MMPDAAARFAASFRLTLLTADPALAAEAEAAGIDRIGIDVERAGKAERQAGHDTRISDHDFGDLARIRAAVTRADVFIRINPPHAATAEEVERALDLGATVIMLPYFHDEAEVAAFAAAVRGRAHAMLLLETPRAIVRLREILAVPGIDEVMVGLNDLRLEMRLDGMEFVGSVVMEAIGEAVRDAGLAFSFGGLGRYDQIGLPVAPDLLYAQYPRLGGGGAWLARSFFRDPPPNWTLADGVAALRGRLAHWAACDPPALEAARAALVAARRDHRR